MNRWRIRAKITIVGAILSLVSHCASASVPGIDKHARKNNATAPSWINTIAAIKTSIAPVVCFNSNSSIKLVDGTAFFVTGEGRFVTARHVVMDFLDGAIACGFAGIYLPKHGWPASGVFTATDNRWFRFFPKECALDEPMDLAVCQTQVDVSSDAAVHIDPVKFGSEFIPDGTEVAFTGFPLKFVIPRSAQTIVAGYGAAENDTSAREMVLDTIVWPGVSGSPVYLIDGSVVGIVLARGLQDATGLAFVRPVNRIRQFLSEHPERDKTKKP